MTRETVVVPGVEAENNFVELSDKGGKRLFKKEILKLGESFIHPGNKAARITVDETFAKTLVDNFKNGVCDIVQFPMVNDKNQHVEDPGSNLGQVVDLTYDDKGVYATIDVRKNADDIGSTILGASAMMNLDYADTITGEKKGPTLLHVAATNRPYLTKLAPYEAVALSNDEDTECVMLSRVDEADTEESETESENPMELEELLAKLKDEHDIDVTALQEEAAKAAQLEAAVEAADAGDEDESDSSEEEKTEEEADAEEESSEDDEKVKEEVAAASNAVSDEDAETLLTALSNVLRAANPDLVALSNSDGDLSVEDLAEGIVELSNGYKSLSQDVTRMKREKAETEVDAAVSEGRILPAKRDAMLELRLSNEELYNQIVPEDAIVGLSAQGVTSHESINAGTEVIDEKAELARRMSDYLTKKKS